MKKHLLLLLLPLMLAACNGTPEASVTSDPTDGGPSDTSGTGTDTGTTTSPDTGTTTSEDGDHSSGVLETATELLPFGNIGWTGTLSHTGKAEEFVQAVNSYVLTSVSVSGFVQVNDFGNVNCLCIGSGSEAGSITFNFSVQVISIKYIVQGYCKYDSYHETWSQDSKPSHITIDGTEYTLDEYTDWGTPAEMQIDKTFTTAVTSTTCSVLKEKARVFLPQMQVTYIVQ